MGVESLHVEYAWVTMQIRVFALFPALRLNTREYTRITRIPRVQTNATLAPRRRQRQPTHPASIHPTPEPQEPSEVSQLQVLGVIRLVRVRIGVPLDRLLLVARALQLLLE